MNPDNYSIKEMIEEFRRDTRESLSRIEIQTMKTNGRVTKSETDITDLKTSRTQVWTAIGVVVFLGSAIITLAIMAIDSKIKDGIQQALVNYENDNNR